MNAFLYKTSMGFLQAGFITYALLGLRTYSWQRKIAAKRKSFNRQPGSRGRNRKRFNKKTLKK